MDRVVRQDGATQVEVACPRVVKDYHALMGGVDVHDQLRLQRYSLQQALRFKKYYKSLVLGLIDVAIVNSYIVHKAFHKNKTSSPLSHVKYLKKLHMQLCSLVPADMYEANTFGTQRPPETDSFEPISIGRSQTTGHTVRQVDE
ncbi:hypothetical protein P3T76_009304 [Phytophthora citrophthora]|uniref:PiggyBac transposable element-derived protein domain-containing protein n=1 Tax=Phytophthora citrophthora TaxID=4793 RepID=A0AAD9LJY9_9STRA|nr:hypothetical protein P3T76_009304 [Phytophthora citrophthora]